MRRISIGTAVVSLLILSQAAFAIELTQGGKPPIGIQAERMSLEYPSKSVLFSGHVRIKGPSYTLASNSLRLIYGVDFHSVTSMVATGDVRIESGTRRATGDKAILNPARHTIELTGTPAVQDHGRVLKGRKIIIHLDCEELNPPNSNGPQDDELPIVASR